MAAEPKALRGQSALGAPLWPSSSFSKSPASQTCRYMDTSAQPAPVAAHLLPSTSTTYHGFCSTLSHVFPRVPLSLRVSRVGIEKPRFLAQFRCLLAGQHLNSPCLCPSLCPLEVTSALPCTLTYPTHREHNPWCTGMDRLTSPGTAQWGRQSQWRPQREHVLR